MNSRLFWWRTLPILVALAACLPTLWLPFGFASEGDALDYRIPILKWMARHHAYPNWPWTFMDDFPMLGELLMLPFFLVKEQFARLVAIVAYFSVAALAALIGCEFINSDKKKHFLFFASCVLGFQPIFLQANQVMVDNIAVAFLLASLLYFLRDQLNKSAIFLALALATRYTIWGAFPGMLVAVLYRRRSISDAAKFGGLALLGALPFLVRNSMVNHNPFFPLLNDWFQQVPIPAYEYVGRGKGLLALLLFPYDLLVTNTFVIELFDTNTVPQGFYSHRLGFAFYFELAAFLYALVAFRIRVFEILRKGYFSRRVRAIFLLGISLFGFWWVGSQNLRYLGAALILLQLAMLIPLAITVPEWLPSSLCVVCAIAIFLAQESVFKITLGWEEPFSKSGYVESARRCFQASGVMPESVVGYSTRDSINGFFDNDFMFVAPKWSHIPTIDEPKPDFIYSGVNLQARPGYVLWPEGKPCLLKLVR